MMNNNFYFKSHKVCCISDVHIGVHQNSQMWLDICTEWADWLIEQLEAQDVKDIVMCGDLFHYRDEIAVNTIHYVTNLLNKFKKFNIIMLVGNHDAYYKDRSDINSLSILSGWENIHIVDNDIFEHEQYGTTMSFVPWGIPANEIPNTDITFGHFEIQNFKLNHTKICTHGLQPTQLLEKSKLVITGHFHTREERDYKQGKIIYLGNPYQMDFGDTGSQKGYYILNLKNSSYTFKPNNISPTHQKLYLSKLVEHGDVDETIKNTIKNNIVRFIVDRNIAPDEIDKLLKLFNSFKPLVITTDYTINFDKFGMEDSNDTDLSGVSIESAIKEFVNLLDVENKDTIIDYTTNLYKQCK